MFSRSAYHTHLGTEYLDQIVSQPEPGDWDTQGLNNDHTRGVLRIVDGMGGYEVPSQGASQESQGLMPDPAGVDARQPSPVVDAPPHPDHVDFMFEVEDYDPEENQDFVLGVGQRTPSR